MLFSVFETSLHPCLSVYGPDPIRGPEGSLTIRVPLYG